MRVRFPSLAPMNLIKMLLKNKEILIDLARINKPIGIELLFMPCLIGMLFAFLEEKNIDYVYLLKLSILFLAGSFALRSLGCIWNDWIDKDIDSKVKRTKQRPFANKLLHLKDTFFFIAILLTIALIVFLNLKTETYKWCILGFVLSVLYPFCKYITNFPQIFLGITFNIGIFIGFESVSNNINYQLIILYLACIFLTITYDSIYAFMDIDCDRKIKVGSTAIIIGKNPKIWIAILYFISAILFIISGLPFLDTSFIYLIVFFNLLRWNPMNEKSCMNLFLFNRWILRNLVFTMTSNILIREFYGDFCFSSFFN